jgi:hypothetical protein
MPTITVKLDKDRASLLKTWARRRKVSKSELVRELIDRAEKIQTGDDLTSWVEANEGRSFGIR